MRSIPMLPAERAWQSAARTATATIATALVLLAAACRGSPSSTGPGGSSNATGAASSPNAGGSANSPLLAFSQCVRSRGVPNFPDPQLGTSHAKFPDAQQLGVGSSQLSTAENACQHLLPAGVDDQFPPAEVQLLLPGMREFSQCMRSRGVPNWPDPTVDAQGRPGFNLVGIHGLDTENSSPIWTKAQECQHLLPRALGGIPVSRPGRPG